MLQSVSGKGKLVDSYVSNKQPLTVYHIEVVTKNYKKVCSSRTTH